jgi:sugar/nucleoside kinase (ribokinase family)
MEESLRLSGCNSVEEAIGFFKSAGTGSAIITHGANEIHYYADNAMFGQVPYTKVPVSAKVREELKENSHKTGDTTGCGDNFTGGVIASIAKQTVSQKKYPLNMLEAVSWGVVSGGFTCFYHGGTWYEEFKGQKLQLINPYFRAYREQIGLNRE